MSHLFLAELSPTRNDNLIIKKASWGALHIHPSSSQESPFMHCSFIKYASGLPLGMGLRCPAPSLLGGVRAGCFTSLLRSVVLPVGPWLLYIQETFSETKNDSFLD